MTLRYADRYPTGMGVHQTPDCYGREAYFSARDDDCQRCRFFDSCAQEVRGMRSSTPQTASNRRIPVREQTAPMPTFRHGPEGRSHAGIILEDESAIERLARDVLTGMCRGGSWEMYEFFTYFRF